jgi:hypothetical protein
VTSSGWYPDPDGSRRLRFWDGERWTDHTAVPADAPPAGGRSPWATPAAPTPPRAGAGTPPPTAWTPGEPAATPVGPPGAGVPHPGVPGMAPPPWTPAAPIRTAWGRAPLLPPLNDWFSATFRTTGARKRTLAIATLLALLPALVCAVALIVASASGDARFVDVDSDSSTAGWMPIEGDDLVVGLSLATSVLSAASYFLVVGAVAHQVRGHLVGRDPAAGASIRWGLRRLPKLIGWTLLAVLVLFAAAVVAIVPVAISWVFVVLTLPAFFVGLFWISVRLMLYPQVVSLAPEGTPVVRTTMRLSENRFWGLLGRTLLMGLAVGVPASLVALPLTLTGQATDSVTTWAVGQLLGTLANGASTTITAVSTVLLYAWVDGPVDPAADA